MSSLMRNAVLAWLVAVVVTAPASAEGGETPAQVILSTIEQLRVALDANKTEDNQQRSERVIAAVEEIVVPRIDMALSGRLILGQHWRVASEEQRNAFIEAYKRLLLRIYAMHALDYMDAKVEILASVASSKDGDSGERTMVRTRVIQDGKRPAAVDYRMVKHDGHWQVFDALVNGVSIVATLRSTLDEDIREHGLDTVIASLREKLNQSAQAPL